ncbi:MAG: hypothetical protein CMF38_03770 [Legionellaceae bacterium]|nr:hypothetical protein [Legionellaceae bacterium]HAF87267.1 ribosome-associated protein [Legionellales bacterium]HCA89395.1 ribosome-associated protein [Legionellales bacterium]|tara:strand:- start:827 stop:1303 length:477 start_codon:yes stop_codon:yes gene_type:complete
MESQSKSAKKRQAHLLTDIGSELVNWPPAHLESLPLTPMIAEALAHARTLKSHGAKRRQAQLIGKLLRAVDFEALEQAYLAVKASHDAKSVQFHELEHWRRRLLDDTRLALTDWVKAYPTTDVQHLRQLIRKAQQEQQHSAEMHAQRALFRYLRTFYL